MKENVEQEFFKAYEEYADALFRHCYFRVYDRELARDLVQETFTRTWTYLIDGKDIKNIRAFLYRVLHNTIVDEIRRKKPVSLDQLQEKGFSPAGESAKTQEDSQTAKEVISALGSVEEPYREAVQMRVIDGLSPKEIAEILGVSQNVVSVRVHRGVHKLREILKNEQ